MDVGGRRVYGDLLVIITDTWGWVCASTTSVAGLMQDDPAAMVSLGMVHYGVGRGRR